MKITTDVVLKAMRAAPAGSCVDLIAERVSDSLNEWMSISGEVAAIRVKISEAEQKKADLLAGFSLEAEKLRMGLERIQQKCPHPVVDNLLGFPICKVCKAREWNAIDK